MAKVNLEFDYIEEREMYQDAFDGAKWKMVVRDLDEWARSLVKYQDTPMIHTQEVRDKIYELTQWEGLSLG